MNVYLLDAREHADYDQFEAWVVFAQTPEDAWAIAEASQEPSELPNVRLGSENGRRVNGAKITFSDIRVERLGENPSVGEPRLVYAAFMRG